MDVIIKIIKSLGIQVLINRVSETVRNNKLKKQGGGFRGMLLGTLDVFT